VPVGGRDSAPRSPNVRWSEVPDVCLVGAEAAQGSTTRGDGGSTGGVGEVCLSRGSLGVSQHFLSGAFLPGRMRVDATERSY
jgi:hypothetical protein